MTQRLAAGSASSSGTTQTGYCGRQGATTPPLNCGFGFGSLARIAAFSATRNVARMRARVATVTGGPGLWGVNTPSRWLTCDVLSQPTLPCRTRARNHREPKVLPKGMRRSIAGP